MLEHTGPPRVSDIVKGLWRDIRNLPAGRKALRSFGLTIGSVGLLAALGVGILTDASRTAVILAGVGTIFWVLGLVAPRGLRPAYYPWMALAAVMGRVMTVVLLTAVYFLVVTPAALLMRAVGRDPMKRSPDRDAASYWIPKAPASDARRRLTRYY